MKLPKAPKLKLPGKDGAEKAARPKAPSVELPPFAQNVFRDLRDRHLLIPAVALLVALVAVPMLLKSDPDPAATASAPVLSDDASAVQPAVLAEQLGGVRDYRKRLDAFKQKNPFEEKFSAPSPDAESVELESVGGESSTGTSTAGGSSAPAGLTSGGSTQPSGSPTVTPAPDPDPADDPDPKPETRYFATRIDVVVFHDGERKELHDVRPGQVIPSRTNAVAMYLGSPFNLESAKFAISEDVTATEGEGDCIPNRANCEFLKLLVGEKQIFTYGLEGERFSITLKAVHRVQVGNGKGD